jgi:hypothetical protein
LRRLIGESDEGVVYASLEKGALYFGDHRPIFAILQELLIDLVDLVKAIRLPAPVDFAVPVQFHTKLHLRGVVLVEIGR